MFSKPQHVIINISPQSNIKRNGIILIRNLPKMSLPITLIVSSGEVYNFPLLILRATMRYAISYYFYQAPTKCTTSHYSYLKPWRSAPLVQFTQRYLSIHSYIQLYTISSSSLIITCIITYWHHTILVIIFNTHHSSCSTSNVLQIEFITTKFQHNTTMKNQ